MNLRIGSLLVFLLPGVLYSQDQARVCFSFDNKTTKDKISNLEPKLVNASFTEDRFGNKDHAVHLFGNPNSYLNLGTSSLLKPKAGSISLWVKVENALWYGTGYNANPLILTKRSREDDFFEAYAFYYMTESKKVAAVYTKDSTNQVFFSSKNKFELQKWHHVVLTYNNDSASFYVDGELDNRFKTGFELEFLEEDSVIVGVTGNKKTTAFLAALSTILSFIIRYLHHSK